MNIIGRARITKIKKVSEKLVVGTIYFPCRVKDDYKTLFFNAKLTEKAMNQFKELKLKEKQDFVIDNAFFGVNCYTKDGKEIVSPEVVITDISQYIPMDEINNGDAPF